MSKLNGYWGACALLVLLVMTAANLPAQGFKVLHSFDGTDGNSSWGEMLQGADGNFYGTTQNGGNGTCNMGCGTVFKITPSGTLTTLHNFTDSPDGALPFAGLVQAANGDLYGVSLAGGTSANCSPSGAHGCGTVFKITLSGTLTTLHSFTGLDGNGPAAPLLLANDGNYYGTTGGGAHYGGGTVFKITPSGTLTTLHVWSGPEGYSPEGALIQARDGNLYGTTFDGGNTTNGTVFKMTLSGAVTSLHTFDNTTGDGAYPYAGLVQGSDGDFYGTTETGGTYLYYGCVYKITADGTVTILHSFNVTDGDIPTGNLVQTSNGNFYGTTPYGGVNNDGTIFVISPSGAFTTLHSFDLTNGGIPYGAVLAANGDFYATTFSGGSNGCQGYGCGTVVRLDLRVAHGSAGGN